MASEDKNVITHIFNKGMNRDVDKWVLPPDYYHYGLNIRIFQSGTTGIIVNCKGNTEITFQLPAGQNICIGSYGQTENNVFYFFNWNSEGFHGVYQYDYLLNSVIPILINIDDTGDIDILQFAERYLILHIDVIKNSKGQSMIYWVDGQVKAKKFNVAKALDKTTTGYGVTITATDINAYKLASIFAPGITYFTDTSRLTNYLYGHLYKSSVRQLFDDGEKNNWSEFSTVALPKNESFTGNAAISNVNNALLITVETGPAIVTDLEIAIKDGSNNFVSIIVLNKVQLAISDDSTYTYTFYNDNTSYSTLDPLKVYRAYSFLPKNPFLQSFATRAMVYGKGYEGFPSVLVGVEVEVIYSDLFIPDSTENQLNEPEFRQSDFNYDYTKEGSGRRRNSRPTLFIGHDVKAGNKFELFGQNGDSDNLYFTYTATNADDAVTVAAAFKQQLVATGRIIPSSEDLPDTDIYTNTISMDGDVEFSFIWKGHFKENATSFGTTSKPPAEEAANSAPPRVNPVSYETLKDTGQSIGTHKSGGSVKYAILYWDEDTRRSNSYTSDACFVRTDFVTQTNGFKKIVHEISVKNQPPVWAKYWELVRTTDLTYGNSFIQMLIQKAIESQSTTNTEYIDLIIGSIYTYQEMYPNTVVTYEFEKNDRVRLIQKTSDETFYTFYETVVLDFKPVGTTETITDDIVTNNTSTVTVAGGTTADNIGRYIVIDNVERLIIAAPSGTTYTLDKTYGTSETYTSFKIVDYRGIIRIRKPINITIEDNSVIEVYKPTQNVETEQKNFYLFGQKYAISDWGTDLRAHTGNVQNQDPLNPSTTPAIVDIVKGTTYVRQRQLPTNNQVPGTQVVIELVESKSYSDFYESDLDDNGKVSPEDDGSGEVLFGSRLRYSNNYIEGTRINGLNDFDNLDREDYNDPWGDFMLLKFRERLLYAYKQLKSGYIPILSTIIQGQDGESATLGTSTKFLNQYQTFAWEGGIGNNPESYASDQTWQYFLSPNSGTDCRIGGDGILPTSKQFGLDESVRNYIDLSVKYSTFVYGGFDRENNERILAFEPYNEYLYNGAFDVANWELFDEELPENTVYEITTHPVNGTAIFDSGTEITTYTPDIDFTGSDPFYYRWSVMNGGGGSSDSSGSGDNPGNWSDPKKFCIRVDDVPVAPPQTYYYNFELSTPFTKDDCESGTHGSVVNYIVPALTYTSTLSQEAADQQAIDQTSQYGQQYANENGTCIPDTAYTELEVTVSTDELTVCSEAPITIYIDGIYSDITTGAIVYTDSGLTITIDEMYTFITDTTGNIYNLDSAEVGSLTGNHCPYPYSTNLALRYAVMELTICALAPETVYIENLYSDIAPGVVVYTDNLLTNPLLGYGFISDLGGTIYAMNTSTGEVLYPTGFSC